MCCIIWLIHVQVGTAPSALDHGLQLSCSALQLALEHTYASTVYVKAARVIFAVEVLSVSISRGAQCRVAGDVANRVVMYRAGSSVSQRLAQCFCRLAIENL